MCISDPVFFSHVAQSRNIWILASGKHTSEFHDWNFQVFAHENVRITKFLSSEHFSCHRAILMKKILGVWEMKAWLEIFLGLSSVCCLHRTTCRSLLSLADTDYSCFIQLVCALSCFPVTTTELRLSRHMADWIWPVPRNTNPNTRRPPKCFIVNLLFFRMCSFPLILGHMRKKMLKILVTYAFFPFLSPSYDI